MKALRSRNLLLIVTLITGLQIQGYTLNKNNDKSSLLFGRVTGSFGKLYAGQWDDMDADDYNRIFTTSLCTVGIGYGIYWYFFKKHKPAEKPIDLNKANYNFMYNRALNNNVTLRHMRVAGQRGATCGYHALKNGILVVNALHGYDADTLQQQLLNTQLSDRLISQWDVYINARRRIAVEKLKGESLAGEEITDLFLIERNKAPLINPGQRYFNYNRTLCTSCELSTLPENQVNQNILANIIQALKKRGSYSHIFILNTGGHWYTVVLHKKADGKREYIAMDTGGLNVRRSSGVRRLIASIEGQAVARAI